MYYPKLRFWCHLMQTRSIFVPFYIIQQSSHSNLPTLHPHSSTHVFAGLRWRYLPCSCLNTEQNNNPIVWIHRRPCGDFTWRMTERMRALTGPVKDSVTPAPWKHHNTIPPLLKMAKKSSIFAKNERTQFYEGQNKQRSTKTKTCKKINKCSKVALRLS